jgi:peroxiredoxin
MPTVEPDRKAPAFSLEDQDGRTHSLKDYAGRPVVLFFSEGRHPRVHT